MGIEKARHVIHQRLTLGLMAPIAFWLLAVAPLPSHGQDPVSAALIGWVRDPSGTAVPAASITLRHLFTNQTRSVLSEADGSYRVAALPWETTRCVPKPKGSRHIPTRS
jgi:hypothetical protein